MNKVSSKFISKVALTVSLGLFVFALTQRCFCTERDCGEPGEGAAILFSGSFGFFLSWSNLTWLANPLLLTSWIVINRNPKLSFTTSLLATIISGSFLLFLNVIDDEAGNYDRITGYELGYWLWVSSSLSMLAWNIFRLYLKPSETFLRK
jgi:hypothetical protein